MLWAALLLMPTLYVNASGGLDSRSYAQAQNPATPWLTIQRAACGSANRATPNSAIAAQDGDTVRVAAGSYDTDLNLNDRFAVCYQAVNPGVTFTADGVVVLSGPSLNSPIIGSNSVDRIKWFADVTLGHFWQGLCDGRGGTVADTKAPGTINTRPDTGPCVVLGAEDCWIEGTDFDGGPEIPIEDADNHEAIRIENSTGTVCRNNRARSFHTADGHGTHFTIYHCPNTTIENNDCADCDAFFAFKNQEDPSGEGVTTALIQKNRVDDVATFIVWSITDDGEEADAVVTRNIVSNVSFAIESTGSTGATDADIFGNTFYNVADIGIFLGLYHGTRFWSNILHTVGEMIHSDAASMPASTFLDLEHNVFFNATIRFYSGIDANRATLALFNAAYANQNNVSPVSIDSDPDLVDPDNGDFSLGPSSPARDLGRHPVSGATMHAGAWQDDGAMIGLETAAADAAFMRGAARAGGWL